MSKAEENAELYCKSTLVGSPYVKKMAYLEGYNQAKKDILSEYGWLVSKVKCLKLKYCHNRETVKAIEEACDMLNEFILTII